MKQVRCQIVGDSSVEKILFLISFTTNSYANEYVPTCFENYKMELIVDNVKVCLELCDTATQEDYDRLRLLSYPGTDVFIIYYLIDSPKSFEHVENKWKPEIKQYCPNIPIVLVGLKEDIRHDTNKIKELNDKKISIITIEQGNSLAKNIKANKFYECSALTQLETSF
ncbi:Rho-related protein racG [Entamoeba marina]